MDSNVGSLFAILGEVGGRKSSNDGCERGDENPQDPNDHHQALEESVQATAK
jgi:hypothetical protein